jgi:hypothetical protein
MKTIKVAFTVPTKDFKGWENAELPVTISEPRNGVFYEDIEYSVVMPDYMFNELANTEPKFKTEYDQNNREISGLFSKKSITRKFKKTQTSILISALQSYFSELTTFINDKHSIETSTMKKKIFISFNHSSNHTHNNLNAAYTGEEIKQSFNYFIGYEIMTDKFSGINRTIKKRYISKILYHRTGSSLHKLDTGFKEKEDLFLQLENYGEATENFEKRYSIIDWTEERELFCERVKLRFQEVNEQLDKFLKDINDDKMEALMSNFEQKMLK